MSIYQRPTLERIVQRIWQGDTLLHAEPLEGGASAQVILLTMQHADGSTRRYAVRVHSEQDRSRNADLAEHEHRLLSALHAAGLPVPKPYFVDATGELYPIPYVVLGFIEGKTEFKPPNLAGFIETCAALLANIHQAKRHLPADTVASLDFLGDRAAHALWWIQYQPDELDESLNEATLREVLRDLFPLQQANESTLLHGDFWAGNLIWRDEQLVGVIDWEDAEMGDPLADLGIARLEMLWAFGQGAMHDFTRAYQARMPHLDYGQRPHWDLFAALRPAGQLSGGWITTWAKNGRSDVTLETMREAHQWFVAQAMNQLGKQT